MSQMIEVKTAELIGPALDWAVAKASEIPMFSMGVDGNWPGNNAVTVATSVNPAVIVDLMGRMFLEANLRSVPWSPSTDWAQGGPLIEKFDVDLFSPLGTGGPWGAAIQMTAEDPMYEGHSPLVAACRAIVAAKIGDVVSVPAELVGGGV